jgi:hypothetical protein
MFFSPTPQMVSKNHFKISTDAKHHDGCIAADAEVTKMTKEIFDSLYGSGYGKALFLTSSLCALLYALCKFLFDDQANNSKIYFDQNM